MLNRPLKEIDKEAIEKLVREGVPESKTLEYKRELPGDTVGDKKEFLADVTSFANASGGHILYGIEELVANGQKTGKPSGVYGIGDIEPDEAIRRLQQIINAGVDPRLTPGVDFHPIEGFDDGKRVLLVRIPRSWSAPHMVKTQNSRFYSRNSAGKQPLDAREIRMAFALSEELPRRLQQFRDERLARIVANEGPIPLVEGAKAVLHVLPMVASDPLFRLDVPTLKAAWRTYRGNEFSGGNQRPNFDGLLSFQWTRENIAAKYTQFFRSGAVEAVSTTVFGSQESPQTIPAARMERAVVETLDSVLTYYRSSAVSPPYVCFLTLMGVAGFHLDPGSRQSGSGYRIDRDVLQLPEAVVDEDTPEVPSVLRPAFDVLWQSAGHDRCLDYDDDGTFLA